VNFAWWGRLSVDTTLTRWSRRTEKQCDIKRNFLVDEEEESTVEGFKEVER
jgi:hypothetical protein